MSQTEKVYIYFLTSFIRSRMSEVFELLGKNEAGIKNILNAVAHRLRAKKIPKKSLEVRKWNQNTFRT